ncbi:MAG: N-formylglutamate amidohydrolase [Archangium sp.]
MFQNVEGVIEFEQFLSGTPSQKWLLVDVPHGATRKRDYDAVFAKMKGELPHELEHFFFVNTDIGAPEGAQWLGKTLAPLGINVVFARCLIPRTFIDPNRVVELSDAEGKVKDGLTAAVPAYITNQEDLAWLREQHRRFHEALSAAYEVICKERDGLALQLHSYSPRSVGIEKVDAGIVNALHAAYVPETYATWPERPAVDLISATKDGSFRTAPKWVDSLLHEYAKAGIDAKENATYHLAPVATGLLYAVRYPQQVVCVELNRGLLADPFVPFGVSTISEEKVARMVGPIARSIQAAFQT